MGYQVDDTRMVGTCSFSAGMVGTTFFAEPVPEDAPVSLTLSSRFTSVNAPQTRLSAMASVLIGGSAIDGLCTVKLEIAVKRIGIESTENMRREMMPWPMDARRMTHVVGRAWQTNDGQPNQ